MSSEPEEIDLTGQNKQPNEKGVRLPNVGTPEINMNEARLDLARNILLGLFIG